MNRKKRGKLKTHKRMGSRPNLMWEFENYIKEKLKAKGIIE